ncbi:MAG: arginine--tRNA ligase [Clostridia bacterium]|nr:arginine--tRNA ligase [Clostridia bacterium]
MTFRETLTEKVKQAFIKAGYDEAYGLVTVSNRPDLCQYQCNGALPLAKVYKKKPMDIAEEIASHLKDDEVFKSVIACPPGFLNISVSDKALTDYINYMQTAEKFGFEETEEKKTAIIDYGGANVAKSLHVGHLRSAIIGESVKRILRFSGHNAIGDVHLGDWGLQMGIVISGIIEQFGIPKLQTEEQREKNITISVLEKTYPAKSKEAKENEEVMAECKRLTKELQKGEGIYFDIWKTVLKVSKADLKRNYQRLGVNFELWYGESDTRNVTGPMIEDLKQRGFAHMDDGALVIDIAEETDNPPLPPFILEKSDGAILYSTTDLATILQRQDEFDPGLILYIVDNRQGTHFKQLFRTAEKTGLKSPKAELFFAGFGTMNGADGKPYKTREGGVMRLEDLLNTLESEALKKVQAAITSGEISDEEMNHIAHIVGIGAVKFADLSNHRSKDYVFDIDKFCSFDGKTGPYIQYSAVRIASILRKLDIKNKDILQPEGDIQRELFLFLTEFPYAVRQSAEDYAPNTLAEYIYQLAVLLNRYYHEYKVLAEQDETKKASRASTLSLAYNLLSCLLDLLGIEIPERM